MCLRELSLWAGRSVRTETMAHMGLCQQGSLLLLFVLSRLFVASEEHLIPACRQMLHICRRIRVYITSRIFPQQFDLFITCSSCHGEVEEAKLELY